MIDKKYLIPIIFLILSGCTTPPVETATVVPVVATAVTLPSATETPTLLPSSPTPLPPTHTSTSVPTATAPPATPCSPLLGYEFSEFRLITARGFTAANPGKDDGHQAIDLSHYRYQDKIYIEGESIVAMYAGRVAAVVKDRWPYGNMVIIETPLSQIQLPPTADPATFAAYQSVYHLYAHMLETPQWQVGDSLACGELIGLVGNTGRSGNAHLHLETRLGPAGITFASLSYYLADSTPAEQAEYLRWRVGAEFLALDPVIFWTSAE